MSDRGPGHTILCTMDCGCVILGNGELRRCPTCAAAMEKPLKLVTSRHEAAVDACNDTVHLHCSCGETLLRQEYATLEQLMNVYFEHVTK